MIVAIAAEEATAIATITTIPRQRAVNTAASLTLDAEGTRD